MSTIRSIVIDKPGDVNVLTLQERTLSSPALEQVLVKVAAAGLNRADVLQRKGLYPAPKNVVQDVPGLEYAGTVIEVGANVQRTKVGQRVMGIVAGGAMSTHLLVPENELTPIPQQLSFEEAAAIPEAFITAYDALVLQAMLEPAEYVLIHAATSGVGSAAMLLAQALGAQVLGTTRSEAKLRKARSLGLECALVQDGAFAETARGWANGSGMDVILDTVGAAYVTENFRALAVTGRMVTIGLLGGAKAEVPLGDFLSKRVRWFGTVLRSRSPLEKAVLVQRFNQEVLPWFEQGKLKPVLDCVLPMEQIAEAHLRMERGEHFGKIVLRW